MSNFFFVSILTSIFIFTFIFIEIKSKDKVVIVRQSRRWSVYENYFDLKRIELIVRIVGEIVIALIISWNYIWHAIYCSV